MDTNFNSLPPLKRFRLLQQQQEQQQQQQLCQPEPKPEQKPKAIPLSPSNLPAKKRKYARDSFFDLNDEKENIPPITPPTHYCLPAKKRTWAFKPEFSPIKSPPPPQLALPIDLPPPPYCLPAKKRTWAFKPEFSPIKSPPPQLALPIDLNLEYDPSVESKMESEDGGEQSGQVEIEVEDVVDGEEEEEEEDDDGILCAVCESTDGDPSDPIVFCDGCELMVHSTCYGNPLVKGIPEGEWFCAQCSDSNSQPTAHKCCLCPVTNGAMKPTSDGRWAHIVCALLVPEVFFEDPEGRDGIDCSKIPKKRWRDRCYLCKQTKGCAIECSEPKCPLAFHVTCGLKEDLTIELKEGKNTGGIVAGFCKKHTELWKKQKQTGKFKIVARDEEQKI